MSAFQRLPVAAAIAGITACGGSSTGAPSGGSPSAMSAAAQLGEKIFEDQTLSVSGQQSCATCHVAAFAFASDQSATGPDHGSPVPWGGPNTNERRFRNAPSLMYASFAPAFFFDADGRPHGGFFRDGRAAILAAQAIEPLTTPFEMANADAAAVIVKLQGRSYLAQFTALYGSAVLNDPATALQRMGPAIAAYETEATEFHPFSRKFDFWQAGKATLTAQELRGLALYNDPSKANCAACHPSTSGNGVTPLFTDFSFDNLGVPRNAKIPSNNAVTATAYTPTNSDDGIQSYYDLGICGTLRHNGTLNLSGICGQFKVPRCAISRSRLPTFTTVNSHRSLQRSDSMSVAIPILSSIIPSRRMAMPPSSMIYPRPMAASFSSISINREAMSVTSATSIPRRFPTTG